MRISLVTASLLLLALNAFALAGEPQADLQWTDEEIAFFEKRIRPILVKHCYECHSSGSDNVKGGLTLDSREGMLEGGDSGGAVVPGAIDESLLIEALRYESYEMPPSGKLPDKVIADFVKWVGMGAPDPRDAPSAASPQTDSPIDWEQARQFWSFQRPTRHVATQADADYVTRPIDGFILDQLADAGLTPSDAADRRTYIRRVSFDLTGLPPTFEETVDFVNDHSPNAYETLIDRLLASPHYGEHWTQLWLDVMRYAEDQAHIVGNNASLFYPNAYLYRDWVIDALNDDMPYDEFVRLQLAADLNHPDQPSRHVATGFIGLGPKYYRRSSPEVQAEEWENQVDTVTRGLLGLTVACARCHDHKYDPIPTEDYYALAGVFAGTELYNRPLDGSAPPAEDVDEENDDKPSKLKPKDAAHVVRDAEVRDLAVMIRGDVTNTGDIVPRRFLQVLCDNEPESFSQGDSGRRELAEAIVSRDNPLTARVIVNRIWAEHFGQPLVGTPSNFGLLGDPPTHPELLDDLAFRFMENGWSLKWLHREIVLSATYRQSSHTSSESQRIDPANRLLSRMNRKRLSIEQWRDAILSASGRLEPAIGGESIIPSDPESRRRTVYSMRSRFELDKMLALFDFPDPSIHAARRVETTTPLQKMFVLNSPFMITQAKTLAERVTAETDGSMNATVGRLHELLFTRPPTDEETRLAATFVEELTAENWSEYAQVLLASNELLIID